VHSYERNFEIYNFEWKGEMYRYDDPKFEIQNYGPDFNVTRLTDFETWTWKTVVNGFPVKHRFAIWDSVFAELTKYILQSVKVSSSNVVNNKYSNRDAEFSYSTDASQGIDIQHLNSVRKWSDDGWSG